MDKMGIAKPPCHVEERDISGIIDKSDRDRSFLTMTMELG